jgi:hypothetical protein
MLAHTGAGREGFSALEALRRKLVSTLEAVFTWNVGLWGNLFVTDCAAEHSCSVMPLWPADGSTSDPVQVSREG